MAQPKIFVSYSHADTKHMDRLLVHLAPLKSAAELEIWTDKQIAGGDAWAPAIDKAISDATVAIFLVTADFLNSDFITRQEVPSLLERRQKEGLRLYPILAKPCAWQAIQWLSSIQIRPTGAKPVWRSGGRYAEDELARIVLELLAIIQLAIQAESSATDEASRQRAEQERREKEKAVAEVIAATPLEEDLYSMVLDHDITVNHPLKLKKPRLTDAEQAQEIYRQIVDDAEKNKAERERIMRDLQTRIFQIVPDVTVPGQKKAEDAFNNMDKYIRGE
jgi:hypothetical protein